MKARAEFAPRNVLVPVDFSALSDRAVEHAKQIARRFGGTIHLLHAVQPVILPIEYAIVPPEMEEINMRQLEENKKRLETLREAVAGEGLRCRAEVKLGKPWRVITEAAKRTRSDLIVIATHGRTGARHLLLGSTTERVVQYAPCSVLVVR